ncbi:MAG: 4-hydroxy-tetrahydrodipicolinate reductase [Bacteroidota bacterium]
MKIALAGTGKTGTAIETMAHDMGHEIVARFNSGDPVLAQQNDKILQHCDVVIDFSQPALALPHITHYCKNSVQVVMGTTGWYTELEHVQRLLAAHTCGLLYAPNFSIGVAVLSRLIEKAAGIMDKIPEYDVSVHEAHHLHKLDSPSGTALHLANILVEGINRKARIEPETQHQQIAADALHVTSQRLGHIFGQHTVTFDSPYDQISISHDAKNRNGFALGALRAAEWIVGKRGLYTLDNLLDDWLSDL